jgi:large subunit ribosomal protein L5
MIKMVEKFRKLYNEIVAPALKENFLYSNIHEIPKIKKIQLNRGLGVSAQNTKILKKSIEEFRLITGQQPVVTKAKQSNAGFKVREEMELGITITLRGKKMYSFLDRLISLSLPRIRDFQGLDPKKFDKHGNYNFGINDQLIFPEIDYENVDQALGLNISIVTSTQNSKESLSLLKKMGLPFRD